MDRKYIDMHLVIDRYLQESLAEGEKADFEERLVWDQELIDELDLAERLREGLRMSVADDKYTARHGNLGIAARLSGLWSVPEYAAAASFLLAVTLTAAMLLLITSAASSRLVTTTLGIMRRKSTGAPPANNLR